MATAVPAQQPCSVGQGHSQAVLQMTGRKSRGHLGQQISHLPTNCSAHVGH